MDDLERHRQDLHAHVLGKNRTWLFAHPDAVLTHEQQERYDALCVRLENGEPLAQLLGEAWFYGRPFTVTRDTLIPRPETEMIITMLLGSGSGTANGVHIVDIGTGSGCIAVTAAAELQDAQVIATDVSSAALAIATHNATRHGVAERIEFLHGNLLEPILQRPHLHRASCIVTANLPYLTTAEWEALPRPLKDFEPRSAFDGGIDGLDPYRAIFMQLPQLAARSLMLDAFLEIDPRRRDALMQWTASMLPDWTATLHTDLAGHARVLKLAAP
ncbi:MAG: peptide chain release factor N(5)-glutamine methyltransferase [bacterium]|nr:peptide chain release factor N(5)-glutamine methyltransferase [bacterium]